MSPPRITPRSSADRAARTPIGDRPGHQPEDAGRAGRSRTGGLYPARAAGDRGPVARPRRSDRHYGNSSWLGTIGDQVLTALLVYGYPALGLTLLLGAIGLPLPDGVATTVAGSLASQGRIDWFWAATIAVTASVLGDCGRLRPRTSAQSEIPRSSWALARPYGNAARAGAIAVRSLGIAHGVHHPHLHVVSQLDRKPAGRISAAIACRNSWRRHWSAAWCGPRAISGSVTASAPIGRRPRAS